MNRRDYESNPDVGDPALPGQPSRLDCFLVDGVRLRDLPGCPSDHTVIEIVNPARVRGRLDIRVVGCDGRKADHLESLDGIVDWTFSAIDSHLDIGLYLEADPGRRVAFKVPIGSRRRLELRTPSSPRATGRPGARSSLLV